MPEQFQMTPTDLIRQAIFNAGVSISQTIYAEEIYRAFGLLNQMIAVWNRKRWLMWALEDVACVSTGVQSYTIGPGQQFDTNRPDRLESAYVRQYPVSNQPFDTYVNLIDSHEDYATITLKKLSTWPTNVFYDSQFPIGNLLWWPVPPSGQFEMHILVKSQVVPFTSITEVIDSDVPPEYFDALAWNLAARLRPIMGLGPDPSITKLASETLNTIRQANVQVSTLSMPYGYVTGRGRNGYGWVLGQTGGF